MSKIKNNKKFIAVLLVYLFVCLIGCKTNNRKITDEIALSSIKNYCYMNFPDLKEIEEEHMVYWEVDSSSDEEVVILFRSYTGAIVKYYINKLSGETYVTETVKGISEEEKRTDEVFNINDYIK